MITIWLHLDYFIYKAFCIYVLIELWWIDIAEDCLKEQTISRSKAEQKAFSEYDEFNKKQKIESDFDKEMKIFLIKNK